MFKKIVPVTILGLAVFIGLSFFGDFNKTGTALLSYKWHLFPIALFLSSLNFFFRFWRWQLLLQKLEVKISLRDSGLIFLSGLAMALTPLRSGELVKSAMLKKQGESISKTIPLVFVERLGDACAMLFLMSWGVMAFAYGKVLFFICIAVICLVVFFLNSRLPSLILKNRFFQRQAWSSHRIKIGNTLASSQTLLSPWFFFAVFILSICAWTASLMDACFIFWTLGINFSWQTFLTLAFICNFSGAVGFITALPGGLGVSEATVTGLLLLFLQLPKNLAAAGVLILRLSTLWFGAVLGIIAISFFYRQKNHANL